MKLFILATAAAMTFCAGGAMAQTADPAPPPTPSSPETGAQSETPRGGYAPATPLFSSPPPAGAKIEFVPSTLTPTQAFPPPAPLANYPICKKGQYDQCRQRGGR
ncbi:MAG: hypothetical protein ABW182_08055 [Sphingomonas sp.]